MKAYIMKKFYKFLNNIPKKRSDKKNKIKIPNFTKKEMLRLLYEDIDTTTKKWTPPADLQVGEEIFMRGIHMCSTPTCGIIKKINVNSIVVRPYLVIKTSVFVGQDIEYTYTWNKSSFNKDIIIKSDKFFTKRSMYIVDHFTRYSYHSYCS